jgi:hypothetical protein
MVLLNRAVIESTGLLHGLGFVLTQDGKVISLEQYRLELEASQEAKKTPQVLLDEVSLA